MSEPDYEGARQIAIEETRDQPLRMSERQVSAHYEIDNMNGLEYLEQDLQQEFGLSKPDSMRMTKMAVKKACQEEFEETHGLTFSTDYVSVERGRYGSYSCTIMTNQV